MAITGLPDGPQVEDMTGVLQRANVGPGMVNTGKVGDLAPLQDLVPAAVEAARAHLEASRAEYDEQVNAPIEEYRRRLTTWEQLSLDTLMAQQHGRRNRVRETADDLTRMTEALRTSGEPLLRILAVLAPGSGNTAGGA